MSRGTAAAGTASVTMPTATHLKVTLMRSTIGLTPKVRKTAIALGFKRRMQAVIHPIRPDLIGKVLGVKELVKVENMTLQQIRDEKRERNKPRSANKGYQVVGNAL